MLQITMETASRYIILMTHQPVLFFTVSVECC